MMIKSLTAGFAVSDQIQPTDIPEIAARGFKVIVDNRPDGEVPDELSSSALQALAQSHDMTFRYLPVSLPNLEDGQADELKDILQKSDAPVFAYCRSGTRAAALWMLARAGEENIEAMLELCAAQGYRLDGMRPLLAKRQSL